MSEKAYFQEGLFEEGPEGPALLGSQCKHCGKRYFPPADFCSDCLGGDFEPVRLSTRGELYSFTVTRVPVAKYPTPHTVGMITLPKDQIRLVAPLVLDEERSYRVGEPVELVVDTLWQEENREIVGYKFRHAEGAV